MNGIGGCIITYQKSNGEVFIRQCKHDYFKKIGDETSMGWKILNIHYEHDGNYYTLESLHKVLRYKKKKHYKERIARFLIKKLRKYAI